MKKRLLLGFTLGLVACGCSMAGGSSVVDEAEQEKLIDSLTPTHAVSIARGEVQQIRFAPLTELDSSRVWIGGGFTELLNGSDHQVEFNTIKSGKLGNTTVKVTAYKGELSQTLYSSFTITSPAKPTYHKVNVISSMPHDKDSYTQGLLVHNGKFYESTGQYGSSALQIVEIKSGKILDRKKLDNKYFGEGLTLLGDKLYQLTWMEQKCFVYNVANLEPCGEFQYQGEGWGLATDSKVLYMSDGSNRITVRNPKDFSIINTIEVYQGTKPLNQINELEWIDGKIWANIYISSQIAVINPISGVVEKLIDCSALTDKIGNLDTADVLNGIAQDEATKKIYLTGKLWDKMFEITIM